MLKTIFNPYSITILMLICSNVFMTFAWYGHLRNMASKAWWIAALASWGIALLEYMIMVPANRIGFTVFTLPQLKIIQEVITLVVFTIFASVCFKGEALHWNHLAAFICLVMAVYFVFMK